MKLIRKKITDKSRTYAYCLKTMKPDAGFVWGLVHHADFLLAKMLYPGIDGLDYFLYRYYENGYKVNKTFITEGDLAVMVRAFNGDKKSRDWARFNDKKRFCSEFSEYIGRRWIGDEVSAGEFTEFCKNTGKLIIKPAGGAQGRGVFFAETVNDDDIAKLYDKVHGKGYIIEEVIKENEKLAALHPQSVNTLRLYTTRSLRDGKLRVTGAVIRIGRGDSGIDNYSSGGMVAEIDAESGIVISHAVDEAGGEFLKHPDTGLDIKGFEVPEWESVKKKALEAHEKVKELNYIAWDVVVREDKSIAFLEANLYGGVHMQQQPSMTGKKELYWGMLS